jgi:4-amino-4-deoxy-L-arabinose transferase-like glycosyltransferase
VTDATAPASRARLVGILAVALAVHVVVLFLLPDQHFPDSGSYRTAGEQFRHWLPLDNNNIMPLYPLLVALVGAGWGQKLADLALSLATVWLVYAITLRIYRDEAIALTAALFCAVWPHFAFFAAVGLTETLFIALVLAALLCLYGARYALASIFFVLGILTRPALELLAPLLILYAVLVMHRGSARSAIMRLAAYVAIYVVLMAPWWLYNYHRYGQFVRLDLAAGIVLYTGNNPLNTSGGGVGKGQDVNLGVLPTITDPIERDAALKREAIDYIKADPWHFVAMMPAKFLRLWRPWPYAGEYQNPLIVAVSVASAVPAFILALIGFALTLRTYFIRLLPCLAYVGYLTFVHVVTFGSVRYRVPLEPVVLILAAAGLFEVLRRIGPGRRPLAPLSAN